MRKIKLGVALVALVALAATASTAVAAHPKKGGIGNGVTSLPFHPLMAVYVSSSGKSMTVGWPSIENVHPPLMRKIKIDRAGRFSGTRSVVSTGGLFNSTNTWTVTFKGRFKSARKATGSFRQKGLLERGEGNQYTVRSGPQTFVITLR
jgi:hypothetical protein